MSAPFVRDHREERGVVLAIVLVLFVLLYAGVSTFQRRAVVDVTVSRNREDAGQAEALARGAARAAEAIVSATVFAAAAQAMQAGQLQPTTLDQEWARLKDADYLPPIPGSKVRIEIQDAGSRMNLNALAPTKIDPTSSTPVSQKAQGAEEFMTAFLQKVIVELQEDATERGDSIDPDKYDVPVLANAVIDYIDSDDVDTEGRYEDQAYGGLGGVSGPANRPLLSVEELGLVPGFDRPLVEAIREYATVYPLDGSSGLNVNTAPSWVLALIFHGPSGEQELASPDIVSGIVELRKENRIVCSNMGADPERCVSLTDVGLGNGSLFSGGDAPISSTIFQVTAEARVGEVTRRYEAVYDYTQLAEPRTLSFRALRDAD